MVTATKYVTADELLHMPDDGYNYELVRGELRKSMPPGYVHDEYAGNIYFSMRSHVSANGLGRVYFEAGFLLGPDHVRAPDTAFVSRERREEIGRRDGYFPGPPDLAIEVVSPSNRRWEIEEKIADYLEAGTKAVIVVYPRRRTVAIHRPNGNVLTLSAGDALEVPDIIPGWSMPVSQIFD